MNFLVRASDLPPPRPFNDDPEVNVFFGQRGINLRVYLRPTEDPRFKPQQEVAAALERLILVLASSGKTVIWDDKRVGAALAEVRKALEQPKEATQ